MLADSAVGLSRSRPNHAGSDNDQLSNPSQQLTKPPPRLTYRRRVNAEGVGQSSLGQHISLNSGCLYDHLKQLRTDDHNVHEGNSNNVSDSSLVRGPTTDFSTPVPLQRKWQLIRNEVHHHRHEFSLVRQNHRARLAKSSRKLSEMKRDTHLMFEKSRARRAQRNDLAP